MPIIRLNPVGVATNQDPGLTQVKQLEDQKVLDEIVYIPGAKPLPLPSNYTVNEVTSVVTNVIQVNAPTGANGQLQFNQNGQYIGDAELQYDPNTDTLNAGTIVANTIRITGNANNLKLNGGNYNDVLQTDGNGNLSWANVFPSVSGNTGKFLVTNGVSIDWSTNNYNSFATTTYVSNAIANLVGTAPAMLDTLGEIANIIGQTNDPQYGVISQLANKANISNLAQVAFSGSYTDLSYKPTISTAGTTGNYADLNGKPTIPASILDLGISDGTVGQVLTTRGNGTYHFTTVTSGSNANIGNIGFSNTVIYSNTGTVINNSDLSNGQTAGLVIPAQGDGNTSALFNTYGNVTILAGNIGNSQPVQAWTFNPAGALFFPQTPYVTSAILVNDTNQELSVSTDRGNISIWPENSKWLFGADGNLTLPGNTFAVNYANGTQVSIGGGGNTGNVTFSDQVVVGTGSNDGSGGLYLAPGNASIANSAVQYLRVRGGDAPTHIHLDTGNNEFYDQYFGADSRYVKLEANGNIVINADDYAGNGASWTFGTDGNTTIPGFITSNNTITIDNQNSGNTADINIYSADNILLQGKDMPVGADAEGGDINIYGGDGSPDDGTDTSGTGGDIQIYAGVGGDANTFSASSGGIMRLRGGGGGDASVTSQAGDGGYIEITGGYAGSDGGNTALGAVGGYIEIIAGGSTLEGVNGANVTISSGVSGPNALAGSVEISTPISANGPGGTWTFDGNGNLTLPDTTSVIATVSITLEANDTGKITGLNLIGDSNANLYAHGNVTIVSDSSNTTPTWTFGTDGKLTVPANSSILTNETALKIATHSTTTYTFNQAYWEALNGNATRMLTITGNAQYFSCTVTANQDGTYTVADLTGNSFEPGDWFKVPGNELGGATPANDIQINIATVDVDGLILTTTITGTAVGKQWTFGADGVLTLPEGSAINDAIEVVAVTLDQFNDGGFSGTQVFTRVSNILYQVLPSGPTMELVSGIWRLKIGVAAYYYSTDLITWSTIAGGLPAPVGTIDTRQALGIKVPDGVPSSVTAIGMTTASWELNPRSNLATTGGSGTGLTVNITETSGYASAIAIATAGTGYTAGDYIAVTSGTSSAAFIIAVAGRISWTFGTDGTLTLPADIASHSWIEPAGNTLSLYKRTGNASSHVTQTAIKWESIVLDQDTGNWPAYAAIYAELPTIDTPAVSISARQGTSGNTSQWVFGADGKLVLSEIGTLSNGSSDWTFGTDGGLTLPGNLVIAGNTSVFGTNASLLQTTDDRPLLALSSGANGAVSSLWVEDIGNVGTSNIAAVYANPTVGSKIVRIAVGQNGVGSGPNLWDFGTDGDLTLPVGGDIVDSNNKSVIRIESPFSIKSADFSAIAGGRYGVNTTSGAVTATLPASPATGGAIFFADAGGAYATNNLIINPNGQTIMGASGNMTVSTNNQSVGLFYNGTTWRTYNAG